jgi:K+/H+ antiporter YhaU regulatory subunit KhtT
VSITDSASGSVKLINRSTKGIAEFLANLQRLVKAFGKYSRKFPRTNQGQVTIQEGIENVKHTLGYVVECSRKIKRLENLKEISTTGGPKLS